MTLNNEWLFSKNPAAGGYEIERSLRFDSASSSYLSRTPASAGNRTTFTFSCWVKLTTFGSDQTIFAGWDGSAGNQFEIRLQSDNTFFLNTGGDSGNRTIATTSAVFRDPSAWYHLVCAVDTTQASASNHFKLYINNSLQTLSLTASGPQNLTTQINGTFLHHVGVARALARYFNGLLADIHFIDGQALTPSSFGEFDANNVWQPIAYSGSYGTNGFHLTFSDNSGTTSTTLGKDAAGSNNWTPNNFSVAAGSGNDSLVDVPTNGDQTDTGVGGEVRGNYCTLNPLAKSANTTLSNGNLDQSTSVSGGSLLGTFGMSSGKWYWEATNGTTGGGYGIALSNINLSQYPGEQANAWSYIYNGYKYNNGSGTSYGNTFTTNDIIGIAFDADNGTLAFYKNGVSQGTAFTGLTSGPYLPLLGASSSSSNANFGQRAFAYTAPSGFKALCTANLPTPTIEDGSTVMDVKLYTGNGSTQTINGLNFSPDFVWIKKRNTSANHVWTDIIRGTGKTLYSDLTAAEDTFSNALTAFNSDGFSVGDGGIVNTSTHTYAAWCWDAGSSTVSNTQGSITSQVRANASAGFSIVTYTGNGTAGATVGHGLGVASQFIVIKQRNTAGASTTDWWVYHTSLGATKGLNLNTTSAATTSTALWNDTAPTSTVFTLGSGSERNYNTGTYVAYCFAPVAGYSSFGSYTGNGSADGPFVYTGFRPRWLLIKPYASYATNTSGNWHICDTTRDSYNESGSKLFANTSGSEVTDNPFDILSNGFKLRRDFDNLNGSGTQYIYAAFAESPFAYARAR